MAWVDRLVFPTGLQASGVTADAVTSVRPGGGGSDFGSAQSGVCLLLPKELPPAFYDMVSEGFGVLDNSVTGCVL